MKSITGAISITRPVNCAITFVTVWGGGIIAGHYLYSPKFLLASISAALITAYGNIINDIFDYNTDKLGKPHRPLVSGTISRRVAIWLAIICLIAGNILSHFVSRYAFTLVSGVSVLLMIYTPLLKGRSYCGNLAVALAGSVAFIYGGMATDEPLRTLIPAGFAFLIHLGREIVKDIEDREADAAIGYRTGAVVNIMTARLLAIAVLLILAVATVMPYLMQFYNRRYLLIVLLGCDTLIALAILRLSRSTEPEVMKQVSFYLKLAMPFGLLAMLVG